MTKRAQVPRRELWTRPPLPQDGVAPGYEAWLAGEIEAAAAELDAGHGVPAEQVWKDLGIE